MQQANVALGPTAELSALEAAEASAADKVATADRDVHTLAVLTTIVALLNLCER